jgi:NhaP-type Na+/H+ or K+/H+ antiporter
VKNLKGRLLGLALIAIFAALIYVNWRQLNTEGRYSMKLAAFGPVGVVGGVFLLLFPSKGGKPETGRDKLIALLVFAVGLAAGLYNWYLMDPGFFGR